MKSDLDSVKVKSVRQKVIRWFSQHGKQYPWRGTTNPFHVLIAEMLLRRTTATAVNRIYPDFIKKHTTPQILADASEVELHQDLSTLGLQKIRATQLKQTARKIVDEYGGEVPEFADELLSLPGVGRYTTAAVLNFAFNKPEPMVDGNIVHFLCRVFSLQLKGQTDPLAWATAHGLGGRKQDKRLYWGIIDLVQALCLRKQPRCSTCPLTTVCSYSLGKHKADNEEENDL